MQIIECKDTLENIINDLKSLCNITAFMGIGCKEYQIQSQEIYFISDCLEKLATTLKEVERSL